MSTTDRFWSDVDKRTSSECWPWIGHRRPRGYGILSVNGRARVASRYSYEINVGPIPDGLWVLHKCDNPPCVNPEHLFLGTIRDNTADMDAKGRRAINRAEDSGAASMTNEQALAIWNSDGRAVDVAARFGTTISIVRAIRLGDTWTSVTGGPATYKRYQARRATDRDDGAVQ